MAAANRDLLADPWVIPLQEYFSGLLSAAMVNGNELIEDRAQVEKGNNYLFVGLYDGHCGVKAAVHLQEKLFPAFFDLIKNDGVVSGQLIESAISNVWLEYNASNPEERIDGSPCLFFLQWNRTIYLTNAGDSKAVLGFSNGADLTIPEQLCQQDTLVVEGSINVPRAIGDCWPMDPQKRAIPKSASYSSFTPKEATPCPTATTTHIRNLAKNDKFVVIGSKGFWDHISNEACVELVAARSDTNPTMIARTLIETAITAALQKCGVSWNQLKAIPPECRKIIFEDMSVFVIFLRRRDNDSISGVTGLVGKSSFDVL